MNPEKNYKPYSGSVSQSFGKIALFPSASIHLCSVYMQVKQQVSLDTSFAKKTKQPNTWQRDGENSASISVQLWLDQSVTFPVVEIFGLKKSLKGFIYFLSVRYRYEGFWNDISIPKTMDTEL